MLLTAPMLALMTGLLAGQTATSGPSRTAPQAERGFLPAPPPGGKRMPNLGMHQLKKDGPLLSGAVTMLPGTVAPTNPPPLGTIIGSLYLPDTAGPYTFATDDQFPLDMWFDNSDPSGSLDETATHADGTPIHFNLHYPTDQDPRDLEFWLADEGIDPSAPTDDLDEILQEIADTGSKARVQEALDILNNSTADV